MTKRTFLYIQGEDKVEKFLYRNGNFNPQKIYEYMISKEIKKCTINIDGEVVKVSIYEYYEINDNLIDLIKAMGITQQDELIVEIKNKDVIDKMCEIDSMNLVPIEYLSNCLKS